jgi:hypothetical protein
VQHQADHVEYLVAKHPRRHTHASLQGQQSAQHVLSVDPAC